MLFKKALLERLEKQQKNIVVRSIKDLPSPSDMKNLVPAAKFIKKSLLEGKRTLIVGDYDADGIMATTILFGFLQEVGFTKEIVDFIIPSRLRDGYGLSPNIIDYAIENGFELIISVDNGISAVDAIKLARENNIDVVITDHHTAPAVLPDANFIVNPRVPGETFPFTYISGATVAWYMTAALTKEFDVKIDFRKYLDFVAITVVSDVMPMNDINIAIFNYGLKLIKERKREIYKLLWNEEKIPTINEVSLGFELVPKVNAIGRISDANIGVDLFLSKDKDEIKRHFDFIKEVNKERQELTRAYTDSAESLLAISENALNGKAIIVKNPDFHEGIVGIIAGKLAEKYQRPAYVFSWSEEKGLWKGSGRSAGDIHLYDLTTQATEFILGFGGHKGAVGVAVKDEDFDNFQNSILENAEKIDDKFFINESKKPFMCDLPEFDFEVLSLLEKYGPFGEGNPAPQFKTLAKVKLMKEMTNGLHFQAEITSGGRTLNALFFNVKKEQFLSKLDSKEEHEIGFYPSKKYIPKSDTYSFELICTLL